MIWTQRSVDMMIGLPSDIILAAVWLIMLASEFGFGLGKIKMDLGDCHVYEEHFDNARIYTNRVLVDNTADHYPVSYLLTCGPKVEFETFTPDDIVIYDYTHESKLEFLLKE